MRITMRPKSIIRLNSNNLLWSIQKQGIANNISVAAVEGRCCYHHHRWRSCCCCFYDWNRYKSNGGSSSLNLSIGSNSSSTPGRNVRKQRFISSTTPSMTTTDTSTTNLTCSSIDSSLNSILRRTNISRILVPVASSFQPLYSMSSIQRQYFSSGSTILRALSTNEYGLSWNRWSSSSSSSSSSFKPPNWKKKCNISISNSITPISTSSCNGLSMMTTTIKTMTTPATTHLNHIININAFSTASSSTDAGPVIRFKNVTFGYNPDIHLLLEQVDFSIPSGSKVTIMGQNGSGKSTLTKLITQQISKSLLQDGQIIVRPRTTIGYAMQTIPVQCRSWTVDQFLYHQLTGSTMPITDTTDENDELNDDDNKDDDYKNSEESSSILPRHQFLSKKGKVLKAVQLHEVLSPSNGGGDRLVSTLSGGQQARLLLAAALIQNPNILILDEPTNNLDHSGLEYLQQFLATTEQTCIVISHDEDFLNSFTDMVLYLDIHSKKVETYMGDYYYVKNEISKRIQRENAENARKQQKALQKKEQANKFANKGGNLRKIAKTMRQVAADMEESIIDVRREDVSLSNFVIPYTQPTEFNGKLMSISHITGYNQSIPLHNGTIQVRKGSKIHLCGPNGIGKSTFLEGIVSSTAPGVVFESNNVSSNSNNGDCRIGYYRQDFYNFDFNKTVLQWMEQVSNHQHNNGELYQIAAKFLLRGTNIMKQPIGTLSEGQKGLLSFASLYILEPTILIVDEPTNHINFRHIPAITHALSNFDGALIIVSHDQEFIQQIGPFETVIDMGKEFQNAAKLEKAAVAV